MDTSRLTSFVVAAEHGSLSKAARHTGVRISTISRQISELESELGEPLLVRTGRGVRLTPAGEVFLERARFILRELEAAIAEVRGERERATKHLRLSVPTELSLSLLPRVVAAFYQKRPDVRLDLHSDARRVSLLEEDFDAALRLGRLTNAELLARRLGEVRLCVCVAPTYARSLTTMKELSTRSFVGVAGTRELLSGQFRKKNVSLRVQPHVRVNTFSEAAELAAATNLVVVLPHYTAERFVRAGTLCIVLAELLLPTIELHMLLPRRHRENAALKEFATLVTEQLQRVESRR